MFDVRGKINPGQSAVFYNAIILIIFLKVYCGQGKELESLAAVWEKYFPLKGKIFIGICFCVFLKKSGRQLRELFVRAGAAVAVVAVAVGRFGQFVIRDKGRKRL